jgi:hypothetical protein
VNSFLHRYATPLTVGLFAVSAISGTALFFGFGQGIFHEMHEWLSMLLLLPFVLHVWKNWPALVGYARRGTLVLPVAAMLLIAVVAAAPSFTGSDAGGPPGSRAATLMTETPISILAPVLKTTPDSLAAKLKGDGYAVDSIDDTLATIAAASHVPAMKLLFAAFPSR